MVREPVHLLAFDTSRQVIFFASFAAKFIEAGAFAPASRVFFAGKEGDSRWQEGIIQQAVRYIDDCYGADISLESTAEAIGVSRFYLSRLFKTHLGMNYSSYLVQKRVSVAEALLKARRLSNREIAELVGFRDPDYFGKVFKRQVGCTMTEYRNRIH